MNRLSFIMMKSKRKQIELKIQQLNEEGILKTCYNADSSIQKLLSCGRLSSRLLQEKPCSL